MGQTSSRPPQSLNAQLQELLQLAADNRKLYLSRSWSWIRVNTWLVVVMALLSSASASLALAQSIVGEKNPFLSWANFGVAVLVPVIPVLKSQLTPNINRVLNKEVSRLYGYLHNDLAFAPAQPSLRPEQLLSYGEQVMLYIQDISVNGGQCPVMPPPVRPWDQQPPAWLKIDVQALADARLKDKVDSGRRSFNSDWDNAATAPDGTYMPPAGGDSAPDADPSDAPVADGSPVHGPKGSSAPTTVGDIETPLIDGGGRQR